MAGYSDLPFRELAWEMGAGLVVSEMTSANPALWSSDKSLLRNERSLRTGPRVVQIEGSEPDLLASAALHHAVQGADIIDINMGCPAKKVCRKAAGSALLQDETLVARILERVVSAVSAWRIPVTLKTRTGWSPDMRNGPVIAHIAEQSGIQALTVHGRTRACRFAGEAEYDTIARIKQRVSIPVVANGDIDSSHRALQVLQKTGVDAVMVGRGTWGAPWLPGQIAAFLKTGIPQAAPPVNAVFDIMQRHLKRIHDFYGVGSGIGIARKHVKCYLNRLGARERWPESITRQVVGAFNRLDSADAQQGFLRHLKNGTDAQKRTKNRSRAA